MQSHSNDGLLRCAADIMKKAQNGDPFAQLDIGKAYYAACQMEGNCSLAFKWISLSAQQGNMEAQFRLGDLYALGQGTEKCHTRAYDWYTKSALQGYSKSLIRIHNLYENDKFMHCKGYQSGEERSRWPMFYVKEKMKARELSEYRLQQSILIQNQAMEFYQQQFNTSIQQKEMKNTDAQLLLGFMYQHGYGTKRNINRAIECYTVAAKDGIAEAQYNLGEIYLNKKQSTRHDTQEAFKWISKAAENGSTLAQCSLAHLYEEGIGVEKDYTESLHWYSLAANMGCTFAQLNIARIYRTGQGIRQDYNKAIEWYNCAAKGGNRAAQNCLDQLHAQDEINPGRNNISKLKYYRNPINGRRMNYLLRQHISEINNINKVKQLQKLAMNAMRRDINAMYEIGIKYQEGVDLPQDSDLSVKWIKKAARGGLEKAQFTMGEMCEEGELIEQDYHKASIWYKKRPLKNNDIFQYNLGLLYFWGNGVRRDYLEASKWFFKSAEKDNNKAQYQLGQMRFHSYGIGKDKEEAFEWYKKAAYQRHGDAMCELGRIYLKGDIVEKDPSTALSWYKHALNNGGEEAGFQLIRIYEDYKNELEYLKTANIFLTDPENTNFKYDIYYKITTCYLKGYIVDQDYVNAYRFIKKSIAMNFKKGKSLLSIPARPERYIDGIDLLKMYTLVSEKGIDNLEYNAGYAYEFGLPGDYSYMTPVKVNISKAIEWYMAASKKGDARADYRLGVIYEEGKDAERDISTAIDFYSKAIEQENTDAMYRLANLYLRGKGVTQNFEKAYQLFTNAHNMGQCYSYLFLKISGDFMNNNVIKDGWYSQVQSDEDDQNELVYYSNENESNLLSLKMLETVGRSGNVAVQYQLGCLYGDSKSDDKDYSKAAYWFDMASQGGITDAYYRLGKLYEEGQGVEKNYLKSLLLYQKAVAKDHDKALYRLARIYQYGLGTPVDFSKCFILYKQSSEQGNDKATMVVTLLKSSPNGLSQANSEEINDLSSSEVDNIISMYEYIANDGDAGVQFELGYYYENSQQKLDHDQAAKWYSMAKNLGHIDATYRLGRLYELGLGTAQNYGYAFELYTIAMEGGLSEATLRLGNMYQKGLGVNVDHKRAFNYYTEASGHGNHEALFKLGQMHDQGIYKPRSTLEALKWYTRSYLKGNDNVQESLYFLYDGDEPYENTFYSRMAKILNSFAKNENHHREKGDYSDSIVYTRLCYMYLFGQGIQKDSDLAWHYLSIAVEVHEYSIKHIFSNSRFHAIKDNAYEVYHMVLKQSEKGDKNALTVLGMLYLGGLILLEEAKEGGETIYSTLFEDIFDLSDDSSYNEKLSIGTVIVPKDYKKALKCFTKVAATGETYAKLIVGQMYHCGYGTKQNFTKASEYYKDVIKTSDWDFIAKTCLGFLYAFGEGVDHDNDLATSYAQAVPPIKGHYFIAAQIFYYGNGAIQNQKTSLTHLLTAGNVEGSEFFCLVKKVDESKLSGHSASANGVYSIVSEGAIQGEVDYLLGIMYEKGQGTRVNYKEAFERFSNAAKCGNKRAEYHLKLYYKDKKFIK